MLSKANGWFEKRSNKERSHLHEGKLLQCSLKAEKESKPRQGYRWYLYRSP